MQGHPMFKRVSGFSEPVVTKSQEPEDWDDKEFIDDPEDKKPECYEPVILPSAPSQVVKQWLLNFVSSLSTCLTSAYCLSRYSIYRQWEVFIESWFKLKDCVLEGGIPFDIVHGANTFELPALNTNFNELFNNAMVNHSTIVMTEVLKCYNGFDNLNSVVDVGGGLGVTINMIISKYPLIKGINYDLPHVIKHAPQYHGIDHVGGDMFQDVPQADAIFMKWILHDWSNDHCVKLLSNCYKALPDDGKVIAVDAILPFVPDSSVFTQVNTNTDAIMMTQDPGGRERTEEDFLALAKKAGFSSIRNKCFVCNFWVMEFHK